MKEGYPNANLVRRARRLEFLNINPDVELLVYLPTENFISKIAIYLVGVWHAHDDHVSKYKDINKLIKKYFQLKKRKYLYFRMAQISHYVRK